MSCAKQYHWNPKPNIITINILNDALLIVVNYLIMHVLNWKRNWINSLQITFVSCILNCTQSQTQNRIFWQSASDKA